MAHTRSRTDAPLIAGRAAPRLAALGLAALPGLALAGHALAGQAALVALALLGPVAAALAWAAVARRLPAPDALAPRARVEAALDASIDGAAKAGRIAACLVLHADDMARLAERLGPRAGESVAATLEERIRRALREADRVVRLDDANIAVALAPMAGADLEVLLGLAARLQTAAQEPVQVDATTLRLSLSVGFARADRLGHAHGGALLAAAEAAMLEARRAGPGSVRAHSPELQARREERQALRADVRDALEAGQIHAWFQPQLCTDTGRVSGFEALARWHHPARGPVPPGEFLPAVEAAGLMERLGETMLAQALAALQAWDRAGRDVGCVGVNLSAAELRSPALPDRIAWELDRFDLAPHRLTLEVLESVISDAPDDIVARNIAALSRMGCGVDLDDFGTGHASITSIRRFAVSRIKIDRSFVAGIDTDRGQQQMVAAILTMCERLELGTVAEGVETPAEHALLAQLGCGHVQGYGIARPMPFEDTLTWLSRHAGSLTDPPPLRRNFG